MNKLWLLLASVPLLSAHCNFEPACTRSYQFRIPVALPQTVDFQPGDTVFFTSSFPSSLTSTSGEAINYAGSVGVDGALAVFRFDSASRRFWNDTLRVQFIPLEGSLRQTFGAYTDYFFLETGGNYQARIGVKVFRPGIYYLRVVEPYSTGLRGADCMFAHFPVTMPTMPASVQLYEQTLGRPSLPADSNLFCFRVR